MSIIMRHYEYFIMNVLIMLYGYWVYIILMIFKCFWLISRIGASMVGWVPAT